MELFLQMITFLKVLDDMKRRHGPDFPTTQHVIYVANTSPYDMPVLQSSRFQLLAFHILLVDAACKELYNTHRPTPFP